MPVRTWRGWASVQTRLTVQMVAVSILCVLGLVLSRSSETRRIDAYLAAEAKEHGELLDRTLELEGGSLEVLAKDYTYWDEMVRFVETGDRTWASVNLDEALNTYRAGAEWVFDAAGSLVYAVHDSALEALIEPVPPGLSVKDAFRNERVCHFFIAGPDGPVEIRGATIHPSDDPERKTPVRGYFLAARSWSRQYLAELARLTGKTMRIEPARAGVKPSAEIARQSGEITFMRPLPGPRGKPELLLTASLRPGWIALALRSGRGLFQLQIAMALLGILGLTLVLWLWVTRPLGLLKRSLASGSTEALKPLVRSRTEFGQLARLVGQFFGQNAALVKEVTERKQAEAELASEAERTRILFEHAPDAYYLSDFHGTFLDGNLAAERLLGYRREELIGKSFLKLDLLLLSEVPKAAGLLVRNALGQATGPDELVLRRRDGTSVTVEINTHVVNIRGRKVVLGSARDITERKRTEAALRESEERFRGIFDAARDGMALADVETGRFVTANTAFCNMVGYGLEEIVRLSVPDIHPSDSLAYVRESFDRQAAGKTALSPDIPVKRRDGSVFYADVNSAAVSLGGRTLLMGVFRDITDRKQVETALRETSAYLDNLIIHANAPIIVWDPDFRITRFNRAFERMTGQKESDVKGQTLDILFPASQRENSHSLIHRTATGERWETVEIPIQHVDGSVFTVLWNSATLYTPDGSVLATIAQGQDITERKRIETALVESELAYRRVFESSNDAMVLFESGRFLDCNEAALRIFGYSTRDEFLSKDVGAISPPRQADGRESRSAIEQHTVTAFRSGRDFFEWLLQRPDGTVFPVDVLLTPLDYRGQKVLQATVRDITERKRAEEEIAQKNTQLVELNDVKNQLLGMAAHDLRNPLSVVNSASAFLLDDAGRLLPEAKRTDFLRRINSSSEFMLRLIDDLLDVAKIEAGRLDLELEDGDLCGLIEENLTLNRMLAEKKGIRLDFAPESGLPSLRFDRGKVGQVLNNLVSNALKFSAPGTVVTVQVSRARGEKREARDESVVVSVRDHGQGIPAEELDKLFKPFSKTSVRTTAGERSTGLGLAICRKIVGGHHGRIWAESEVGKGSVFSFSLPVAVPD